MRVLKTALLVAGLFAVSQLIAQDDAADAADLYQVEVLIFRHVDQARNTAEIARLVKPEMDDVLEQQLARLSDETPVTIDGANYAGDKINAPFWKAADRNNSLMQADADRLRKLQAYELIDHLAWVQSAADVAVAQPIQVSELDPNTTLSGTLKLYSKRYLHLAVDLKLGTGTNTGTSNAFRQFLPVDEALPAIVDSRRMRLGRTIYFDHPQFGVLATVSKLDAASP